MGLRPGSGGRASSPWSTPWSGRSRGGKWPPTGRSPGCSAPHARPASLAGRCTAPRTDPGCHASESSSRAERAASTSASAIPMPSAGCWSVKVCASRWTGAWTSNPTSGTQSLRGSGSGLRGGPPGGPHRRPDLCTPRSPRAQRGEGRASPPGTDSREIPRPAPDSGAGRGPWESGVGHSRSIRGQFRE